MKLFNTENGKEVVYVQLQDIMYLSHETDIPIPATIFTKACTGLTIVNDSNRFDFVRFDDVHEVKFFKELDFIIDNNKYKDLTDEQLEKEGKKLTNKANEIAEKWNSMTKDERKESSSLFYDHRNIDYMLNFISEVYAINHGERTMPFPNFVKMPKKTKKKPFSRKKM